MMFEQAYNKWLQQVADLPQKTKFKYGHKVQCSKHRTKPAMMLRKLKRLNGWNVNYE